MYIQELKIDNFRSFDTATVKFIHPTAEASESDLRYPNVTLLVGNNGSGKSSVLKACVLGVLDQSLNTTGWRPHYEVRRRPQEVNESPPATIGYHLILHGQDSEPYKSWAHGWMNYSKDGKVTIQRTISQESVDTTSPFSDPRSHPLFDDQSPAFFIVAYGANRRVEASENTNFASRDKSRSLRYQRVASIYEEYFELIHPATAVRLAMQSRWRSEFETISAAVLPDGVTLDPTIHTNVSFRVGGVSLPFGALSDGHRGYIGWVFDLLYHMIQSVNSNTATVPGEPLPHLRDLQGVVLIDEVDLFLHPEWQRVVISKIASAFPKLQFICSTHSPIVAGTVESRNLLVTSIDHNSGASIIFQPQESIYGLSADQILTSSYFGLVTSRAPGAEEGLDEIARRAWAGDDAAALDYLKHLAHGFDPTVATTADRT